jgi:hypothetical protein
LLEQPSSCLFPSNSKFVPRSKSSARPRSLFTDQISHQLVKLDKKGKLNSGQTRSMELYLYTGLSDFAMASKKLFLILVADQAN